VTPRRELESIARNAGKRIHQRDQRERAAELARWQELQYEVLDIADHYRYASIREMILAWDDDCGKQWAMAYKRAYNDDRQARMIVAEARLELVKYE
jgi:hypothetical protein